jgi:PAS domain S-box-containing protein
MAQADHTFPLILVALRKTETAEVLRSLLEREGFAVLCASNGRSAEQLTRRHRPALLLLDQALPLVDGLELCRILRQTGEEAVIFIVSDRSDELSKLLAFGAGADDYLAFPMHPRELLGRMQAALRRASRAVTTRGVVRCGPLELDPERREARVASQRLDLTSLEFELLTIFVAHPGRVFSREDLLDRLAGFLRGEPYDRAIDIHVSNVRRKVRVALGDNAPIETVRGVGYRLRADPSPGAQASGAATGELGQLALAALGRLPTPLLVLSRDRTVVLYNEAAEQLCGWRAEEVAGQVKCYSLLGCHDEDGTLLCHGRCVLQQGQLDSAGDQQHRYVITRKDGREVPVDAHYSRLGEAKDPGESTLLVLQPQA